MEKFWKWNFKNKFAIFGKFGNWILKIKFQKKWNFEKLFWKLEFQKIILRMKFWNIEFKNWTFGNIGNFGNGISEN